MKKILVDRQIILNHYRDVSPISHKGTLGHALLIGGSYGKMGAVTLAAKAALKAGCGLVTAYIPKCGCEILQISIPEAMVITDQTQNYISNINHDLNPQAIGIGPGIGQNQETQKAFGDFLQQVSVPLVIDADALNILSANKIWFGNLPPNTILTPHPKEFERLVGTWKADSEKIEKAMQLSIKYEVIIILKGAPTVIIDGDSVYENTTGNAALATAGSGDVLTGIITGLLAQGYEPISAAIMGVYLHGLTADIALPETGTQSFIASDIIANLGKAYLSLQQK